MLFYGISFSFRPDKIGGAFMIVNRINTCCYSCPAG